MKTKKLAILSILVALSLILSYVDSIIPIMLIPGMRLGLANIVTMFGLALLSKKETALLLFVRILLVALLFGSAVSILYALAGGLISFLAMAGLSATNKFSLWAISMVGGALHTMAQVCVAALIFKQIAVFSLLPWLLFWGILTGIAIGVVAELCIKRMGHRLSALL